MILGCIQKIIILLSHPEEIKIMHPIVDIVIVGGGINGCGAAADAAQRGLSVLLCEQGDLASQTSSNSSKLIHGGLRYLEHFDFSLVKKALNERQSLLELAPHLVQALAFVLPHTPKARSRWLLSLGLFLYDHLSCRNKLPRHQFINRIKKPTYFTPLKTDFHQGFLFYDGKTDDARLVMANALQAKEHGARIMVNTKLIHAQCHDNQWKLTLQHQDNTCSYVHARAVINATGPWVEATSQLFGNTSSPSMTLVQGSHVVVPKLYTGEHAYILQDDTNRVVFAIPYHEHTLVGTTETLFHGAPGNSHISDEEKDYLCAIIHRYFDASFTQENIISTFTGVRTLLATDGKTATALSRDYAYQMTTKPAPLVTIYSGKITTYRELSEVIIDDLRSIFPKLPASTTKITPLPGAKYQTMSFDNYQHYFHTQYAWLDVAIRTRYLKTYGTYAEKILTGRNNITELGQFFGATLYQAEVDYLVQKEWASTVDDILWRRTKLGLIKHDIKVDELRDYLEQHHEH
jgi:glycerol-3-phosphate dehydrogenase